MDLAENNQYRMLDVWNMTRETVFTGVSGHFDVKLPGRDGIAVLAVKE